LLADENKYINYAFVATFTELRFSTVKILHWQQIHHRCRYINTSWYTHNPLQTASSDKPFKHASFADEVKQEMKNGGYYSEAFACDENVTLKNNKHKQHQCNI